MAKHGLERTDIVGHRIDRVLQTPWIAYEGFEIEGIVDKTWYTCELFLVLDNDDLIHVEQKRLRRVDRAGLTLVRAGQWCRENWSAVDGTTILEVIRRREEHDVFVALDRARFISTALDTGGKLIWLRAPSDLCDDLAYLTYWGRRPFDPRSLTGDVGRGTS